MSRVLTTTYSNRDFLGSLVNELNFIISSCNDDEKVIFISDIYGVDIESKCENLIILNVDGLVLSVIKARLSQIISKMSTGSNIHLVFTNPTLPESLELNFSSNIRTRVIVDTSEYGTGGYTFNYSNGDSILLKLVDKGSTFRRVSARSSSVLEVFSILDKLTSSSIGPIVMLNDLEDLEIDSKNLDKLVILDGVEQVNHVLVNDVLSKQAVPGVIPVKVLLTSERLVYTELYRELLPRLGNTHVYSVYNNFGKTKIDTYIIESDTISMCHKNLKVRKVI